MQDVYFPMEEYYLNNLVVLIVFLMKYNRTNM